MQWSWSGLLSLGRHELVDGAELVDSIELVSADLGWDNMFV